MERCETCQQSFALRNNAEEVVKCAFCEKYFHGVCQNISEKAVVKYINSGTRTIWSCNTCECKREYVMKFLSKFEEQEKLLSQMCAEFKELRNEMNNLKKQNVIQTPNTPTVKRTFASMVDSSSTFRAAKIPKTSNVKKSVNQTKEKEKKTVLVIQHNAGLDKSTKIESALKGALNPLKDPVKAMKKTSKNKIVVQLKDDTVLDTMKTRMREIVGPGFRVDKPKEKTLTLKLVGLPTKIDKDLLLQCIGAEIDCSDCDKRVVVKRINKDIAFVECADKEIYKNLLSKEKLYIQWNVVRVQVYVNLRRCYNCQVFGHTADDCEESVVYCPKCADTHEIDECKSEKMCCINCTRRNQKGESLPTDHYVWSKVCPTVQERLKTIKK